MLSIGPSGSALTTSVGRGNGERSAAKATSRVAFHRRAASDGRIGSGSRDAAEAPSAATTTSRAACSVPSSRITRPGSTARTRVPSRTLPSGRRAASCRGMASIPPRGRHASPSENIAKSKRNTAAAVSSDRSRNTPPKKGTKNPRMKSSENPRVASSSRVVRSPGCTTASGSIAPLRTPRIAAPRSRAVRRPSPIPTAPERSEPTAANGRRQGSLTLRRRPASATRAPGSNRPSPSAGGSSCRRPSG